MKKLTLDEAWDKCLAMYGWVVEQKKAGSTASTEMLKKQWLIENGYADGEITLSCFFCEYGRQHTDFSNCDYCPGTLVDRNFNCGNWMYHTEDFYEELTNLNSIRKERDE